MQERVQKILAARGIASRRKAEDWIAAGRVMVNGNVCVLGMTADPETDTICLDGKEIGSPEKMTYIMLHKPRGYVTTMQDEKNRRTVADLVDAGVRVYPVGRLDMDSEGLLLMTNDGELTNSLMHPSGEITKTYHVWVTNYTEEGLNQMQKSMVIDGYRIQPAKVQLLRKEGQKSVLSVVIHEGRNRQIRKMAEKCGMEVKRLKRVQEGNLGLGKLKPGSWRYLTDDEVQSLKNHIQKQQC